MAVTFLHVVQDHGDGEGAALREEEPLRDYIQREATSFLAGLRTLRAAGREKTAA